MHSIVITGASSGIGQQAARQFSKSGYYVILVGRNADRLKASKEALQEPQHSSLVVADIATQEGCNAVIHEASEVHKAHSLKCLVNNAGVFHRKPFLETSESIWKEQYETNFLSCVRLIHGCLDLLKKTKNSSIVNISSTVAQRPIAETSAYSSMKAALESLTKVLALELAPTVRVNAIAPGIINTPIHDFHEKAGGELQQQLNSLQPMNRLGTPEEVATAIEYLTSEAASWITGSIFTIDGGISL